MKRILRLGDGYALTSTYDTEKKRLGRGPLGIGFDTASEVHHASDSVYPPAGSPFSALSAEKGEPAKLTGLSEANQEAFSLNCVAGSAPMFSRGLATYKPHISHVCLGFNMLVIPGKRVGYITNIPVGCTPCIVCRSSPKLNTFATFVAVVLALFMCLTAAQQVSAQRAEPADAVKWGDIEWESAASSSSDRISAAPQTGDSIPPELWNTPLLLWNAADNSTKTVTLNDYRGKVIILDFWATWCKSCIANMPRMHQLQDQFEDEFVVLPVTYEDIGVASSFLERTADKGMTALRPSFQSIIADSVLKRVFPNPNRTIPYYALVDRDGLYKGTTTTQYLTEDLIIGLKEGSPVFIPELRTAPTEPSLGWMASNEVEKVSSTYYHTMLSHYMHGAGEPTGQTIDSLSATEWQYYINQPLLRLFGLALGSPLPRQANRRIMLVDSAIRFDDHSLRNPEYERFVYDYCYEATYPTGTPKKAVKARMLADLNTLTGVKGQLINKSVPSLVLQRKGQGQSHPAPNREVGWFTPKAIVGFLNRRYDIAVPPVLDETGFEGQIWMDDSARKGSIADVLEVLRRQGFDLTEENRDLEMFLLTDSNSEVEVGQLSLTLTKFGYVSEEGSHE